MPYLVLAIGRTLCRLRTTRIVAIFAAARPHNIKALQSSEAQICFISVFVSVGLPGFEPATHGLGIPCFLFVYVNLHRRSP